MFGCDASTPFLTGACYHVVDLAMSFCVGQWLGSQSFSRIIVGLHLTNAMQPVLDPRSVDYVCEDLLIGSFHKDKEGGFVASSNFRGQACFGEDANELLELIGSLVLVYMLSARVFSTWIGRSPLGTL